MHGTRAVRTFRAALIALIGVLVMSVGAANAYAGGSDHGNGSGHQKWASDEGQQSGGQWSSDSSDDQSWSSDSESTDHGDCKKNESSTGEKTGEQTPPTSPQGVTGGEQKGEQGGEQQGEEQKKGEEHQKGEHGKKEEENKGETAPTPTPTQPTTPAVVTTPAPAPVQAQQAPAQGGEVQGESEQAPQKKSQGAAAPSRGGRVLAENETTTPTAGESQLAETGFDVWPLALLGVLCIAGSAVLLRRARRS
jgi:hypothetical protein